VDETGYRPLADLALAPAMRKGQERVADDTAFGVERQNSRLVVSS
jgi:hypothetical protein